MKTQLHLCYFRRIDQGQQADIPTNNPIDWLKVCLMLLSMIILCLSIAMPYFFMTGNSAGYASVTYIIYGLYAVQILSIAVGIIWHKIQLRKYKYHWLILFVQLLMTVSAFLYVFYKLADGLSSF